MIHMKLQSINPATDEIIGEFEGMDADAAVAATQACRAAQQKWRELPIEERVKPLQKLALLTRERAAEYGKLATLEMGKPIQQAVAEVEKCAWVCEYYAQHAAEHLALDIVESDASKSYVRFDPLGVLLAIMPWNFPFWQVYRAAVPAIAAGNGVVLKHASNVPQCAMKLEEIFRDAGFPEHLFTTLLVDAKTANMLIEEDAVDCVTITGSTAAGAAVAANAGKHLKKIVLELGGSDPFIVLADADLEKAAETAVTARNQNNGQSCIAAKRFIVEKPVMEAFEKTLLALYANLKIGDPLDETVNIGPLAQKRFRDDIDALVQDAVQKGAKCLTGGKPWGQAGAFYEPTIIRGITPKMRLYREEAFGPVLSLYEVWDADAAVELANDSEFGLGASIWTRDIERAEALAAQIESGAVFINGMVKSDPRLPFGGVKKSGHGRELGAYGIREFVNTKTVYVSS